MNDMTDKELIDYWMGRALTAENKLAHMREAMARAFKVMEERRA